MGKRYEGENGGGIQYLRVFYEAGGELVVTNLVRRGTKSLRGRSLVLARKFWTNG